MPASRAPLRAFPSDVQREPTSKESTHGTIEAIVPPLSPKPGAPCPVELPSHGMEGPASHIMPMARNGSATHEPAMPHFFSGIEQPLLASGVPIEGDLIEGDLGCANPRVTRQPLVQGQSAPVAVAVVVDASKVSIVCRGDVSLPELKQRLQTTVGRYQLDLVSLHVNGARQPIGRISHGKH